MAEQSALSERVKKAAELAGYGPGGDSAASRKAVMAATGMSKMGISKLFNGKSEDITVMNLFLIADLFKVDARWLGTGYGDIRQASLPTDAQDVAAKLSAIQDPATRRAAIAAARLVASDPAMHIANIMDGVSETHRWTPSVKRIADGLEAMEDGELKHIAIAWATTAAFNPERLPQDETGPKTQVAARANSTRRAKS